MAHHGSTPLSVLTAPLLEPRWVHEHTGPNRFARRHFTTETGAVRTIPKTLRQPATNVPYVVGLFRLPKAHPAGRRLGLVAVVA